VTFLTFKNSPLPHDLIPHPHSSSSVVVSHLSKANRQVCLLQPSFHSSPIAYCFLDFGSIQWVQWVVVVVGLAVVEVIEVVVGAVEVGFSVVVVVAVAQHSTVGQAPSSTTTAT
jgi:hypothetical protein